MVEGGINVVNKELYEAWQSNSKVQTINSLKPNVQEQLRKRTYDFTKSLKILSSWNQEKKEESTDTKICECDPRGNNNREVKEEPDNPAEKEQCEGSLETVIENKIYTNGRTGPTLDVDEIKLRNVERKKVRCTFINLAFPRRNL